MLALHRIQHARRHLQARGDHDIHQLRAEAYRGRAVSQVEGPIGVGRLTETIASAKGGWRTLVPVAGVDPDSSAWMPLTVGS